MVDSSPVSQLKTTLDGLLPFLESEPSLALSAREVLAKALLLAGASELEHDLHQIFVRYFEEATGGNRDASQFVEKKALARQYHTLFDWDANNVNRLFGLFGPDFKSYATQRVLEDEELQADIRAFIRLGSERNQLVHGNFAAYHLSLTAEEIIDLYSHAVRFRDALTRLLRRQV